MQVFRQTAPEREMPLGIAVSVIVAQAGAEGEELVHGLARMGGLVDAEGEMYAAISAVMDDPMGYDLFVMDCDGLGGIAAGEKAVSTLTGIGSRIPVILISRDCPAQAFPEEGRGPVHLRAPVSHLSLKVAMDHALRHLMIFRAA